MSVHLLTGADESVLRTAVTDLVHRVVGDGERALMVDEFDGEDYELRNVVDAAQTLPFLTDRRVVVARGVGRFTSDELAPLLAYLSDPLPTSDLVLVGGGGRLAKSLTDAVKRAGGTTTSTDPPQRPRDRSEWIAERAAAAGVRLAAPAAGAIAARLGEDVGRLDGLLTTLAATFGASRALKPEDVDPFIGEDGGVPPWDLTDAVDSGDTAGALGLLARMTGAGGRHPLQLMAILHAHYVRLARLDGLDVRSEAQAADVLGIKGFPAKKALTQYRRLGGDGVRRAIDLLAGADLDLRGRRDLDPDVVMEILVARLSRLRR
jgi:DNA polymerase III subunit delta